MEYLQTSCYPTSSDVLFGRALDWLIINSQQDQFSRLLEIFLKSYPSIAKYKIAYVVLKVLYDNSNGLDSSLATDVLDEIQDPIKGQNILALIQNCLQSIDILENDNAAKFIMETYRKCGDLELLKSFIQRIPNSGHDKLLETIRQNHVVHVLRYLSLSPQVSTILPEYHLIYYNCLSNAANYNADDAKGLLEQLVASFDFIDLEKSLQLACLSLTNTFVDNDELNLAAKCINLFSEPFDSAISLQYLIIKSKVALNCVLKNPEEKKHSHFVSVNIPKLLHLLRRHSDIDTIYDGCQLIWSSLNILKSIIYSSSPNSFIDIVKTCLEIQEENFFTSEFSSKLNLELAEAFESQCLYGQALKHARASLEAANPADKEKLEYITYRIETKFNPVNSGSSLESRVLVLIEQAALSNDKLLSIFALQKALDYLIEKDKAISKIDLFGENDRLCAYEEDPKRHRLIFECIVNIFVMSDAIEHPEVHLQAASLLSQNSWTVQKEDMIHVYRARCKLLHHINDTQTLKTSIAEFISEWFPDSEKAEYSCYQWYLNNFTKEVINLVSKTPVLELSQWSALYDKIYRQADHLDNHLVESFCLSYTRILLNNLNTSKSNLPSKKEKASKADSSLESKFLEEVCSFGISCNRSEISSTKLCLISLYYDIQGSKYKGTAPIEFEGSSMIISSLVYLDRCKKFTEKEREIMENVSNSILEQIDLPIHERGLLNVKVQIVAEKMNQLSIVGKHLKVLIEASEIFVDLSDAFIYFLSVTHRLMSSKDVNFQLEAVYDNFVQTLNTIPNDNPEKYGVILIYISYFSQTMTKERQHEWITFLLRLMESQSVKVENTLKQCFENLVFNNWDSLDSKLKREIWSKKRNLFDDDHLKTMFIVGNSIQN